jgi:hypothetical protein
MCPLCIATGSVLLATAGSAGGLTAVTAKMLRTRWAKRRQSEAQSIALAAAPAPSPGLPQSASELAAE